MNPVRGPRDAAVRAGIKPVNHARHNVLAVKDLSQMNALRKAAEQPDERPGLKLPPGVCMEWWVVSCLFWGRGRGREGRRREWQARRRGSLARAHVMCAFWKGGGEQEGARQIAWWST